MSSNQSETKTSLSTGTAEGQRAVSNAVTFTPLTADLSQLPAPDSIETKASAAAESTDPKIEVTTTFGDAHGNALLGLWHALKVGAVAFPAGSEHLYKAFFEAYEAERTRRLNLRAQNTLLPTQEKAELQQRYNIIKNVLAKLQLKNPQVVLRFLGDLLSDRGANDLFTLLFLDRLKQLNVKFTILISNHDMYFLSAYEQAKKDAASGRISFTESMKSHYFDKNNPGQGPSARRFIAALEAGLVSEQEFQNLVESYKSRLRVIDYNFIPAQDSPTGKDQLQLNMHGVVGVEAIRFYAQRFGITYEDDTAKKLMATIDKINFRFQQALRKGDPLITEYNQQLSQARNNEEGSTYFKNSKNLSAEQKKQAAPQITAAYQETAAINPLIYGCEARGNDPTSMHHSTKLPACNLEMIALPRSATYEVSVIHGHHHFKPEQPEANAIAEKRLYSLDQLFGKDDGPRGYSSKGDVSVHQQKVGLDTPRQEADALFDKLMSVEVDNQTKLAKSTKAFELSNTQRQRKNLAYAVGGVGLAGATGIGTSLLVRALVPKENLATFFLKAIPNLSRTNLLTTTGLTLGLVIGFIAAADILRRGYGHSRMQQSLQVRGHQLKEKISAASKQALEDEENLSAKLFPGNK